MSQSAFMSVVGVIAAVVVIIKFPKALANYFGPKSKAGRSSILVLSAILLVAMFLVCGPIVN